MAITYVGGDSDKRSSATSLFPSFSGISYQADDFAVIIVIAGNDGLTQTITVATGWTDWRYDEYTAGFDHGTTLFYKKLTDTELDPVITTSAGASRSCCLAVYRGVDTTTPFDTTEQYDNALNSINPNQPPITTVTNNAAVLLMNGDTGIQAYGAPSGYTIGPSMPNDPASSSVIAHNLDVGTAGTETPGAWSNTGAGTEEHSSYTVALRNADAGGASALPLLNAYYHG